LDSLWIILGASVVRDAGAECGEEAAMDFCPDVPPAGDRDEFEEPPQQAWRSAPEDVLPGVVPVELMLGRSDSTVVMLTGMRALRPGLA
jgi:hypothetical protein